MSWASRDRHRDRHRDRYRDRDRAKHLTDPEVSVMFLGVGLEIRLMNGIIISERHSHVYAKIERWIKILIFDQVISFLRLSQFFSFAPFI